MSFTSSPTASSPSASPTTSSRRPTRPSRRSTGSASETGTSRPKARSSMANHRADPNRTCRWKGDWGEPQTKSCDAKVGTRHLPSDRTRGNGFLVMTMCPKHDRSFGAARHRAARRATGTKEFTPNDSTATCVIEECDEQVYTRVARGRTEIWRHCRSHGEDMRRHLPFGWFEAQLALQGGACKICGRNIVGVYAVQNASGKRDHERRFAHTDHSHKKARDHDHSSRRMCGDCVRGLLCGNCNHALGLLDDNIDTLRSMIAYLKEYE